jgi:hypothetical protein
MSIQTLRYIREKSLNKTGNLRTNATLSSRLRNHGGSGRAISITCSGCVSVALVIQHAKRMRCMILSFVA